MGEYPPLTVLAFGEVKDAPGTVRISLVIPPEAREPENEAEFNEVTELAHNHGWLVEITEA